MVVATCSFKQRLIRHNNTRHSQRRVRETIRKYPTHLRGIIPCSTSCVMGRRTSSFTLRARTITKRPAINNSRFDGDVCNPNILLTFLVLVHRQLQRTGINNGLRWRYLSCVTTAQRIEVEAVHDVQLWRLTVTTTWWLTERETLLLVT